MSRKQSTARTPATREEEQREMETYMVDNYDYYQDHDMGMDGTRDDDLKDCCYLDDFLDEDMEEDLPPYEVSAEMEELMKLHGIEHKHIYDDGHYQEVDMRYEYDYDTAYHSTVWYKQLFQKYPTYRDMIDYQISQIIVPTDTTTPSSDQASSTRKYRIITDRDPDLRAKFELMARKIEPFVQIGTGDVHPDFPSSVLAFNLMNEAQLDAVAEFYHQAQAGGPYWLQYPCPVYWRKDMEVADKRTLMGNFIGIIPRESVLPAEVEMWLAELEVELMRRAEQARIEEDEREAIRRKCYMY
jgi:hypothetical protein